MMDHTWLLSAQETPLTSASHCMSRLPSLGAGLAQSAPCMQLQKRLLKMLENLKRKENKHAEVANRAEYLNKL